MYKRQVPFNALIDNPFGRDGDIDQSVTVPPRLFGSSGVISESLVSAKKLELYETEFGGISLIVIVTLAVSVPPLFVTVIVYAVSGETTLGVPLISPLEVSNNRPVGSVGEIDHVATGPPVEVGTIVFICRPICVVNVVVL